MVFGPHPYAHLTDVQKKLFFVYIMIPHRDFQFDSQNWTIRSVNDDGTEEIIEFTNDIEYGILARSLGATERMPWSQAVRFGSHLIDMGPEGIRAINLIVRRQLRLKEKEKEKEKELVNWGRDGF